MRNISMNFLTKFKWLFYKVLFPFLLFYILFYILTYGISTIAALDFERLSSSELEYRLLISDILTFAIIPILMIGGSIYFYIKLPKLEIPRIKEKLLLKVILSFLLSYLITFVLDPFYHNFSMIEVPAFTTNLKFSWRLFFDFLQVLIIAPIFEELFFRGFLINPFLQKKSPLTGVLITSLLYSISHFYILQYDYKIDYVNMLHLFFMGIVFGLLRIKYGLLFAFLAHFFYNFIFFLDDSWMVDLYLFHYIIDHRIYWLTYLICISIVIFICSKLIRHDS